MVRRFPLSTVGFVGLVSDDRRAPLLRSGSRLPEFDLKTGIVMQRPRWHRTTYVDK